MSDREHSERVHLVLPDGRAIDYVVKISPKARSLRLKLSARDGMAVIAPPSLSHKKLHALVASKADWVEKRLAEFDAVRHLITTESAARPQAFDLPALGESWRVEYKQTRGRTVGARIDQPGRLVVAGAIEDIEACHAALRRWLARRAMERLAPWLATLASDAGLEYRDLTVKNQRTRWGSCSSTGRISLNCKLLFLQPEQVRYVLLHELCHLIEANHSERFWIHMRRLAPRAEALHSRMRDAWKCVPVWAQPVVSGEF